MPSEPQASRERSEACEGRQTLKTGRCVFCLFWYNTCNVQGRPGWTIQSHISGSSTGYCRRSRQHEQWPDPGRSGLRHLTANVEGQALPQAARFGRNEPEPGRQRQQAGSGLPRDSNCRRSLRPPRGATRREYSCSPRFLQAHQICYVLKGWAWGICCCGPRCEYLQTCLKEIDFRPRAGNELPVLCSPFPQGGFHGLHHAGQDGAACTNVSCEKPEAEHWHRNPKSNGLT